MIRSAHCRTLALALALGTAALAAPDGRAATRKDRGSTGPTSAAKLPSLAEKTAGMERRAGFLDLWLDRERAAVWLELPPPSGERGSILDLLYLEGLTSGLGSNPIGLDRGQISEARYLEVRRIGRRILFEEPNLRFRATSDDPAERLAARESFATSVIWGTEIVAEDPDGRSLVDLSGFLVRDAHGVGATLKWSDEGSFALDPERSAIDLARCLVFPDNVELEAVLTFAGDDPGPELRRTAPSPGSFTLVQHHSFLRPPDDRYRPRRLDPRVAVFGITFQDYATPLDRPLERQWIARHRLDPVDPAAPTSEAVEPIVYYVDSGAPEPVRSALLDGARWWERAFAAAGWENAFRVELLPADAHPLDVRYNVVQWVHRSTRGWSYGNAIADPRTGEIVKGHVNLGSLRVRHDRILFEGLAGTAGTGSGAPDDPVQLALARLRQLAAHEVGHSLGLAHNFAASTYDDRASVMDYPAPLIRPSGDGGLDFSRAYGIGVGSWDIACIRYAYQAVPPGRDEDEVLEQWVRQILADGHRFVADPDARPASAADPRGSLWDNGDDPVAELASVIGVRRIALARFGESNVLPGVPLAKLEEVLAPLYFHHRYQLEAAVKVLGGMETDYAIRGDGQTPVRLVPGDRQREALAGVLEVLDPAFLDLPEPLLLLLPHRPFEAPPTREAFARATGAAFDALGAAATAADHAVALLLEPARLARLLDFHRRDRELPGVEEVLDALLASAFPVPGTSLEGRLEAVAERVQRVTVERLLNAAGDPTVAPEAAASISSRLDRLATDLLAPDSRLPIRPAHAAALAGEIRRFLERELKGDPARPHAGPPPPGSPIGAFLAATGCGG